MNSSQFLLKPIPIDRIMQIAKCHFVDTMPIYDKGANNSVNLNIPVGTGETEFPIDSIGNWHLLVTHITGTFTTVQDAEGGPEDDGVNRLMFNINLGGWNRDISRLFFPVDHFFTPGRVRHPTATNNTGATQCPPSSTLLVPKPFPLLLLKTQAITVSFKSSSTVANIATMTLHGWRVSMDEKALQKLLDSMESRPASMKP